MSARFDVCSLRNARTESSLAAISSGLPSFEPPAVKLNKPGVSVGRIATLCLKINKLSIYILQSLVQHSPQICYVSPHMPSLKAIELMVNDNENKRESIHALIPPLLYHQQQIAQMSSRPGKLSQVTS